MNHRTFKRFFLFAVALVAMDAGLVSAAIVNGDFGSGDFTGWTFFNDPDGTTNGDPNSNGNPEIATFDVTGKGENSAALFRVGRPTGTFRPQGGGIYQNIDTTAGQLVLSVDFAVEAVGNNAHGGLFELMVNGSVVDSLDIPAVTVGEVIRNSLEASLSVGAGSQEVRVAIRRLYAAGSASTPVQYLDNVIASGSAVAIPEPTSTAFLAVLGGCYLGRRIRSR